MFHWDNFAVLYQVSRHMLAIVTVLKRINLPPISDVLPNIFFDSVRYIWFAVSRLPTPLPVINKRQIRSRFRRTFKAKNRKFKRN